MSGFSHGVLVMEIEAVKMQYHQSQTSTYEKIIVTNHPLPLNNAVQLTFLNNACQHWRQGIAETNHGS